MALLKETRRQSWRLRTGLATQPQLLREDLRESDSDDVRRRRRIVSLSMAGFATLGAVSLFQTGVVRHLPDPPIRGFDSDKVNSSELAYQWGMPDGTLSAAAFALNLPLAAWGGRRRAKARPWIPLAAAAKAGIEAGAALWYFAQMPRREKAWCGFCIAGAALNVAILAFALPEANRAVREMAGKAGR